MEPMIQIAGVIDLQEAKMLSEAGATHLGFPLRLHDGREDLSETEARQVIAALGPGVSSIVITYRGTAEEIVPFCNGLGVDGVQLHGAIPTTELEAIRRARPGLFLIKSLVVRQDNIAELETLVRELSPLVDAFITDTYDPTTGRSGATGLTHDWKVSRRLVELSPKPVILAGGLNADNVRAAIFEVRSAGVDSHTGVERPDGRKDPALVRRFVAEAKEGFRQLK